MLQCMELLTTTNSVTFKNSPLTRLEFDLNNFMLGWRPVTTVVVEVDKSPFHFFEVFQLHLQCLSNVVCLEKAHCLWQNDIHLDQKLVAKVKSTDCVNVCDLVVVAQCDPSQLSEKVWTRCVPRQHLYLFCDITSINSSCNNYNIIRIKAKPSAASPVYRFMTACLWTSYS